LFFTDGKRRIDYILAWSTKGDPEELEEARKAREVFEKNLEEEGLELEYDTVILSLLTSADIEFIDELIFLDICL